MDMLWQSLSVPAKEAVDNYFANPRSDLLDSVDNVSGVRSVLDIGCGTGATAIEARKRWPDCRLIGIEPNAIAAKRASAVMDQVMVGGIEDYLPFKSIPEASLDVVLAGDVLEHLYNPWKVLDDLRTFISSNGTVVASIPNVRHLSIFDQLSRGMWSYEKSGLLDITHVRFFTRLTAIEMFEQCGYEILECSYRFDGRYDSLLDQMLDKETIQINLGSLSIAANKADLFELCSLQFIIVARPKR